MRFHEYSSALTHLSPEQKSLLRNRGLDNEAACAEYYLRKLEQADSQNNSVEVAEALWITGWHDGGCPYYDVYPSIMKMLCGISLDFPGKLVQMPMETECMLVRLPKVDHYLCVDGVCVRQLGFFIYSINDKEILSIWIDTGEEINGRPVNTIRIVELDDVHLTDAFDALPKDESYNLGQRLPDELALRCAKLCICLCLLGDNPELIVPQVLARDRKRLNDANLQQLIERAKRRGKFAFAIGKDIEVIPHVRRPHPALVWTGKGRKIPRIVMRKGSVIHREVAEKVPTDFYPGE